MRFSYQAINAEGSAVSGIVEAESQLQALTLLSQRGLRPFRAEAEVTSKPAGISFFSSLSINWRAQFYREMATLLIAGIGIDRALGILMSQSARAIERKLLESAKKEVSAGTSLSVALEQQGAGIGPEELGLIRAGEQSGSLGKALENLGRQLQRRIEVQSKIRSALVYPAFLMVLAPAALVVIATVLVPNLAPLFEDTKTPMPFALATMVGISRELRERGLIWLLIILLSCFALIRLFGSRRVSRNWQKLRLKLPIIGTLMRHSETARFAQVLATLLQSGAPLQTALLHAGESMTTNSTRAQIMSARKMVIEGATLASALRGVTSLGKNTLQLVAIGEETNQLASLLGHISEIEGKALETRIERLMTLLTPVLTILLGLMIGGIVMSIMKAILSINQLAGS